MAIGSSIKFIFGQAFVSLKRNIWLTMASILTVMISLTLLGSAIFFLVNASNWAETFESQVEIASFLQKNLSAEQINDIKQEIEKIEGVASIELTTKEQAVKEFEESMGTDSLLEDVGGINPFPDKLTVVAIDAHLVADVAAQISTIQGVEKVRYGQGILEKLLQFTDWLRWIGIGVVVAFAFASLLLISLNIKTNVYSRQKEIQIMRLVGASNAFIRWPFFIEGLMMGLLGALVSAAVVGGGYTWLSGYIATTLPFLPIVGNLQFIYTVLGITVASGMVMGALASAISIRRFLHI